MPEESFLWHDYETFGRDPTRERPVQFAAIRTDHNLQQIDDGVMIYCRQTNDYLPDPESCMVHGVLPQTANERGLSELQFATEIHALMSTPGTCTVGYNSIRFDDEFSRQLFFRNLFDPYAREWQSGNSRWDLIDLIRLARALRPDGINWPTNADGQPSNKLEHLTAANGISHGDAHDALADVQATIEIARLIKRAQPKLYHYALHNKSKRAVQDMLNLVEKKPVLHVSGMYPATLEHTSIVMPLGPHPSNSNGILVYDLRVNPQDLIKLPKETIAERIFTRAADLPDGISRIAIKTVHTNRCPVLAPVSTLTNENKERLNLDVSQALQYRELIIANPSIMEKLNWVFSARSHTPVHDPDLTLYSGSFASDADRRLMQSLHADLARQGTLPETGPFADSRFSELLFRLRARNTPAVLNPADTQKWRDFCHKRVHLGEERFRSISDYESALDNLQHNNPNGAISADLISALRQYGREVAAFSA
ncbi:exodeoxyribonuclease I [Chromatiales bacterium (ex Bugula neritina AB1)]|nr:exodeoxyribonuclease I [Chromatiales bacterium (ex Bugula neritina AB1)]